jgi:hypothetical protein
MTLFTKKKFQIHIRQKRILYTGYFTGDNEPNGTKNAPHNTFSSSSWKQLVLVFFLFDIKLTSKLM